MTTTAGSLLTNLATGLSGLTSGQMLLLGGHLTASNGAKGLLYLSNMLAMPAQAGTFLNLLGQLQNIPPEVVTDATSAMTVIGTPAYAQAIMQAQAALQRVLASENAIQQATGI